MHIGVCTIQLQLLANHSLKEKRRIIKSIKDKVKNKYNVSIAEIDSLDKWQLATLGIACVSNDSRFANSTLSNVIEFIDNMRVADLIDYHIEIL